MLYACMDAYVCMYVYGASIRRGKARQGMRVSPDHGLCTSVPRYLCTGYEGRGGGEWGVGSLSVNPD